MSKSDKNQRKRSPKDASDLEETFLEQLGEDNQVSPHEFEEAHPMYFGPAAMSWMVVNIQNDGQEARMEKICLSGNLDLGVEDLRKALEECYLIREGVDVNALDDILALAKVDAHQILNCSQIIAAGRQPVPGENGFLRWIEDTKHSDIEKASQAGNLFHLDSFDGISTDFEAVLALPEQTIAKIQLPTQGETGLDVFGKEQILPGSNANIKMGINVRLEDNQIIAECLGYVVFDIDTVSIIPPIWVDQSKMNVFYIHLELLYSPSPIDRKWIDNILEEMSICHGVDETKITYLCSEDFSINRFALTRIAIGDDAIPGTDTQIEYTFDPELHAGKILSDGSIDFRERNSVIGVVSNQLLATVYPATEGLPKINVYGEEEPTTDGKNINYHAGQNVIVENIDNETSISYKAEIDGNVHVSGKTLHVKPLYTVKGDVDYNTGNINSPVDVHVMGTVRSGFTIESGGSITVSGGVESGTKLIAQGDVLVSQGIVGEKTTVIARGLLSLGKVQTKFLQNASLLAQGDVDIGSYIYNSQVRSGGKVIVHSGAGNRGGSIVGGEILASESITARLIGSATATNTTVGIIADPVSAIKLSKLEKKLTQLRNAIDHYLNMLGIRAFDSNRVKSILQRASEKRRSQLGGLITKLYQATRAQEQMNSEREVLIEENKRIERSGHITAQGTIFSGVEVKLSTESIIVKTDLIQTFLYLDQQGIQHRPIMQ
ncbi:MAG: FapA family protein [Candidatus Latescibacterota bacterium]|nr:FapA family protein [Candidatus Latescibacterota bacterium]